MPIISNKLDSSVSKNFLFRENSILLKGDSLPDFQVLQKCLNLDALCDWFYEKENDYCAAILEKDSPNPAGLCDIPLREFFAKSKDAPLAARARGLLHFREQKRFCARCGGALKDDETQVARTCIRCKTQFFPQLEPAIIVLVKKGDEILLARHANRAKDFWTTLAGFVEIGETAETAVKREIFEETAVNVKNIRYVASQSWPFPDQLMLAFVAEYDSGEIKVQEDEILEANWFKRDSLPQIPPRGSVAYSLITGEFD